MINTEDRFLNKINKTDSCWLWTGALNSKGYGSIRIDGKSVGTHVYSYKLYKGEVSEGLLVCHTCDIPNCVNPEHLWLGNSKDNAVDMVNKGRVGASSKPQTHCRKGHEFEIFGVYNYVKNGKQERTCKECKKIRDKSRSGKSKIL
jgi:hypothetical protein